MFIPLFFIGFQHVSTCFNHPRWCRISQSQLWNRHLSWRFVTIPLSSSIIADSWDELVPVHPGTEKLWSASLKELNTWNPRTDFRAQNMTHRSWGSSLSISGSHWTKNPWNRQPIIPVATASLGLLGKISSDSGVIKHIAGKSPSWVRWFSQLREFPASHVWWHRNIFSYQDLQPNGYCFWHLPHFPVKESPWNYLVVSSEWFGAMAIHIIQKYSLFSMGSQGATKSFPAT